MNIVVNMDMAREYIYVNFNLEIKRFCSTPPEESSGYATVFSIYMYFTLLFLFKPEILKTNMEIFCLCRRKTLFYIQ